MSRVSQQLHAVCPSMLWASLHQYHCKLLALVYIPARTLVSVVEFFFLDSHDAVPTPFSSDPIGW